MSNIIKIKRGSSVPSGSDLEHYELGYRTGTTELYINDGDTYRQLGGGATTSGSNNQILTDDGSGGINSEGTLTYDGSVVKINTPTATSRRLEFRDSTTGANAWIGLPSWDSDAWHFYGPTSSGNQIASKYVNNYWEWYSNGTLSMRLISGVLKMRGLSAYEGGQIELEPPTDSAYTNQWTIDNFYDHFRIFNSTTAGEQFAITEAGDMSILPGTKFNLDGRGNHTYITESSSDTLDFVVGGQQMLRMFEGGTDQISADDNVRLGVGSSQDFMMWHDTSHTYVKNTTGDLYIQQHADDKDIVFQCDDGSGNVTNYMQIDGSAERTLFNKHIRVNDNVEVQIGSSNDMPIYHNGTNSLIDNYTGSLIIQTRADDEDIILKSDDGSGGVTAYLTIDGGANKIIANENIDIVTSSDEMMRFKRSGADEVSIEQDSSQLYFYNRTTSKVMFLMSETGSAKLGYNSNPELELRNTATSTGSGASLTFGHSQSGTNSVARISSYLTDGSQANRSGHLRFWTRQAGTESLAMQLQANNYLRLYQEGDTTDYLELYVTDTRAYYHHAHTGSSGAYHRFVTDNGYIELGPANTGWGHINTDRGKFYFNNQIVVDSGIVAPYDEDLQLRYRYDSSANRIDVSNGYSRIICGNGEKFRVSSDGRVNYNGWTAVDHITVRSQGHTNSGSANTFFIKFCTVVVDDSPANYNGVSLSGKIYRGDNGHGNWIDWSVWFNNGLDSAQIAHGGFMRSNGAHWISNILVQRTAGDGEIDNGSCTYELYYDINENWTNNIYNVATEVHYTSEGKFNVTWNHDQSEVTSLPGTQVVNMQTNYYDDGNQTLVQSGAVGAPSYSFLASRNTGMYRGASDTIDFTNGGTRMLTIQADGDLELRSDGSSQGAYIERVGGIKFTWDRDSYGTAIEHSIRSSSDNLIISSYDDVTINLDSNNNDSSETFDIRKHATSLTGGTLLFQVDGAGLCSSYGGYGSIDGSAGSPSFRFNNDADTGMYRTGANGLGFSTGGTNRMSLSDNGLAISRNANPDGDANMALNLSGSYGGGIHFTDTKHSGIWNLANGTELHFGVGGASYASPGSDQGLFMMEDNGDFHADEDVIAFSSSVGSDKKFKKNIKDTSYGLSDVMKMRAVEYDWIEKRKGKHDIGVIAQEIEKIIPEVVQDVKSIGGSEGTHKVVDYGKLASVLIKAIQEQQQQINELKEKLNG